jgi:hypothetical protein
VERTGDLVIAFIAFTGIFLTTMTASRLHCVDENLKPASAARPRKFEELRAGHLSQHTAGFAVEVDRNGSVPGWITGSRWLARRSPAARWL